MTHLCLDTLQGLERRLCGPRIAFSASARGCLEALVELDTEKILQKTI